MIAVLSTLLSCPFTFGCYVAPKCTRAWLCKLLLLPEDLFVPDSAQPTSVLRPLSFALPYSLQVASCSEAWNHWPSQTNTHWVLVCAGYSFLWTVSSILQFLKACLQWNSPVGMQQWELLGEIQDVLRCNQEFSLAVKLTGPGQEEKLQSVS